MDPTIIQAVTVLGAAGALLYVVNLLVGGKLHTSSETDGLRQDKADLLRVNAAHATANKASNEKLAEVLSLLRELANDRPDDAR